jgi:tetratricopeptide (TPR) repeat protein
MSRPIARSFVPQWRLPWRLRVKIPAIASGKRSNHAIPILLALALLTPSPSRAQAAPSPAAATPAATVAAPTAVAPATLPPQKIYPLVNWYDIRLLAIVAFLLFLAVLGYILNHHCDRLWRERSQSGMEALLAGRYAEAQQRLSSATRLAGLLGRKDLRLAHALRNLSLAFDFQNRHAEAEGRLGRAIEIIEKLLGTEHPEVAEALSARAALLRRLDRQAEADQAESRARAIAAKYAAPSS